MVLTAISSILLIALLCFIALHALKALKNQAPASSSFRSILLLLALFGLGLGSYFLSGDILGGDAHSHTARTWLFADILSHGELPIWTNRWYLGYPIGLYYGFLYYFLSGGLSLISGLSPLLMTKLFACALHIASGFAFFGLVSRRGNRPAASLFASLFFVYSFQHTGIVVVAGALPLGLIFLLLPLLFITLERVKDSPIRELLYLSIQAAGLGSALFFTHAQYGFYALLSFFGVALLRSLIAVLRKERAYAWALAKFLLLHGTILFLFSGWFLLPLILEKQYLLLSANDTLNDLFGTMAWQDMGQALKGLLLPSRGMAWIYFYFGCIPMAFTLLGTLGSLARFRHISSGQASYALAFILGFPLALSSRFVSIWYFVACLLSAWGIQMALDSERIKRCPKRIQDKASSLLLALLLIDCGFTLVQRSNHPLPSFDPGQPDTLSGRFATLNTSRDTLWRSLDVIVTGRSSIFGGIPQCSTKTHVYVAAICTKAAVELFDKNEELGDISRDAFRILNVGYLLVPTRQRAYAFKEATPAIFAPRAILGASKYTGLEAQTWSSVRPKFEDRSLDDSPIEEIVREMGLQPDQPRANAIVMHSSLEPSLVSRLNGGDRRPESANFVILKSRELHTRFDMEYRADSEGIVQLSYAYFPYLQAKIDGTAVESYKSALGLMVLSIPSGQHSLSLEAGVSPLRIVLLWLAMAALIPLLIFSILYRSSQKA